MKLRRLPESAYVASSSRATESIGRVISAVDLDFNGTVTASASATPRTNGTLALLGDLEISQAGERHWQTRGETLRTIDALLNGGFNKYLAEAPTGAGDFDFVAACHLDLNKIIPGMAINATEKKATFRGQFGSLAKYVMTADAAKITASSSNLEAQVMSPDYELTNGFVRPGVSQDTMDLSNQGLIQHTIHFGQDTLLPGIVLEAEDASGGSGADFFTDGLIRRVRVEITRKGHGTQERHYATWSQLRKLTARRAGWSAEDYERGVGAVLIPLIDERSSNFGGAMLFREGESITIEIDTTGSVSNEFQGVLPSAGDKCYVTKLAGHFVAGSGDTSPQKTRVATTRPAAKARRSRGLRR